jgi:uncharacterized protein (TIGR03435 family)
MMRKTALFQVATVVLGAALTVTAMGPIATAQANSPLSPDSSAKLPPWDVVSIKQADADKCAAGAGSWLRPDGLSFHCVRILFLVESAYQIMESSRIVGLPGWAKSDTLWEIDARVAGSDAAAFSKLTRKERDLMVRTLLTGRFRMKAHSEQREMPVYELTVAKGGPKLKASTPEEDDKAKIVGGQGGAGRIEAVAATMDALPWMLGDEVGRPVLNKTGLTGKYDFTLQYLPSERAAADESATPSIFTAIEEQLGLKLVPARDMADVLVIDSIEQPTAN